MGDAVEIVFATSGCGARSAWAFVISGCLLLLAGWLIISRASSPQSQQAPEPEIEVSAFPRQIDRLAFYSIVALAALATAVPAFAVAMGKSNSSLVASGEKIEVKGCVLARPFTSNFDRQEMEAKYRVVRGKGKALHKLILSQEGLRTVEIGLGKIEVDSRLVQIVPEVMNLYARQLENDGEHVPAYLQK
ncbi:MAG: hypothetical protein AB7I34_21465 [Rhizobiaceae bacterium]